VSYYAHSFGPESNKLEDNVPLAAENNIGWDKSQQHRLLNPLGWQRQGVDGGFSWFLPWSGTKLA
jgi:hypothetical protein